MWQGVPAHRCGFVNAGHQLILVAVLSEMWGMQGNLCGITGDHSHRVRLGMWRPGKAEIAEGEGRPRSGPDRTPSSAAACCRWTTEWRGGCVAAGGAVLAGPAGLPDGVLALEQMSGLVGASKTGRD